MYLNKAKKEKLSMLISEYGYWSMTRDLRGTKHIYAIRRQAEVIIELRDMGIPNSQESWAEKVVADPYYYPEQ